MKKTPWWLGLVFLASCAGLSKDCTSCSATNFGADWIVVQYKFDGAPMNCWKLQDVSLESEEHSDGIQWKAEGHMMHLAGWYNHIQVTDGNWESAAKHMGIDLSRCANGTYLPEKAPQ